MALAPAVPPFSFGNDDPRFAEEDLVTTQMCCAVHLDGKFANVVARQLGTLPHTAVWPNLRINYPILLRQANFARGRRALRDLELLLWLLVLVVGWVLIVSQMMAGNLNITASLLGVLAVTLAVYAGAGVTVWFFYAELMAIVLELAEKPKEAEKRLNAFPGLPSRAPGLPPKQLSDAQKAYGGFIFGLARYLAGFDGYLHGLKEEVRARYREFAGRAPQREKSTQDQMAYLAAQPHANVMLFDRRMNPFELAGEPLDQWQITLDLGRNADSGKHLPAITGRALHHRLLETVPDGSLPNLDARSMYVVAGLHPKERDLFDHWRRCRCLCTCDCAGNRECACGCRAALDDERLCPDSDAWLQEQQGLTGPELEAAVAQRRAGRKPAMDLNAVAGEKNNPEGWYLEHPEFVVNQDALDELIDGPPEGGRVYAYFRNYSWRGQVVVGAAVRVYRALNTLYIEFDAHVMPPLHDGFDNWLELPTTERTERKALWKTTLARTPTLLFQSMRSMYMLWCTPSGRMGVTRELQAKREADGRIDYGTATNLRLTVADHDRLWHFPYVDEIDTADVLRDRVIDCVEKYLNSYGVELTEFYQKIWLIRVRQASWRDRVAEKKKAEK